MFTPVLFITVKMWKQPKCSSIEEELNCGLSREWNITKSEIGCYNMDEPQKHYAN